MFGFMWKGTRVLLLKDTIKKLLDDPAYSSKGGQEVLRAKIDSILKDHFDLVGIHALEKLKNVSEKEAKELSKEYWESSRRYIGWRDTLSGAACVVIACVTEYYHIDGGLAASEKEELRQMLSSILKEV